MRDPGEEDGALVEAAREGDRQAFALLYHRYKPDVWNLAYLTLRDTAEAEDCLQETFVRALRSLGSGTPVEAARPWLLTICRNACLDRLRSAKRRGYVSFDAEDAPEPPLPAIDEDARVDLHRAIARLEPEDREAFVLVDVLGYRSHEAAQILGLAAPSTLRSRLSRARRLIAPALTGARADPAAEIWGVYHQPPDNAVVACFRSGPGPGARTAAEQIDLSSELERLRESAGAVRGAVGLVDFFDRLDVRIPPMLRVLAVIDGALARTPASARHWLADHPRWQVRSAGSHAGWLLAVETLLRAAGADRDQAALDALDAPTPFLWTHAG